MNQLTSTHWPDFLIIGAGKSGTTSLDNYLRQHPGVYMPPVKEPNFYGFEPFSEADFAKDAGALQYFQESVTDKEEYLGLFMDAASDQVKGEVSNTYLYHEYACGQIKKYVPGVKLVSIFRQPAERLFSRYLHLARENRLPTEHFEDCLNEDSIWWERNDLIPEGFYFKHLSKFYEEFPEAQIKVILYDDFRNNPGQVLEDLYSFLGVDSSFKADTTINFNKSGIVKNKLYDSIFGQTGVITKTMQKVVPSKMYGELRNSQTLHRMLNGLRNRNLHRPAFDPTLKSKVTDIYAEDIRSLSGLIKRDLTHWLPNQ